MKLSTATKINLFVIFIGLVIFLVHYCSPPSLVAWGMNINSPDWACIFENSDRVEVLWFTLSKGQTIFMFIAITLFALFMNQPPEYKPIYLNNKGFTLVEVMMVVAIMGILAGIAFLSIDSKPFRQRAAARELFSVFHLAKMEAIKRNSTVSVGVNDKDYAVWCKGQRLSTGSFNQTISVDSANIASGGVNKTTPPTVVPQAVQDQITNQCGGQLVNCQPLIDYLKPFAGTVYNHLTEFNSRGLISTGNGTYKVHSQQTYIPINVNLAGGISVGTKQND